MQNLIHGVMVSGDVMECGQLWVRAQVRSNQRLLNWYLLLLCKACSIKEKEQRLADSESG